MTTKFSPVAAKIPSEWMLAILIGQGDAVIESFPGREWQCGAHSHLSGGERRNQKGGFNQAGQAAPNDDNLEMQSMEGSGGMDKSRLNTTTCGGCWW